MDQMDIHFNLDMELIKFSQTYPIDIVFPNTSYVPTEGTDYIEVSYINGDVFQREIVSGSFNRTFIILQLDLYVSPGNGKAKVKEISNALQPFFKRGSVINNNTLNTRVTKYSLIEAEFEPQEYSYIVSISTRTDYTND